MDELEQQKFYYHMIYMELSENLRTLTEAYRKNTAQLRELNHRLDKYFKEGKG